MREKKLVSSAINGTELLRSMALREKNSFAFRVLPATALAETALVRCGKMPDAKRVRANEQQFVVGELMRRVSYFSGAFSFPDAVNLTETLNDMRLRFAVDESDGLHKALVRGEFADKNAGLLEVYDLYIRWMSDNLRIDDIGLIRYAIDQAGEMDAEFLVSAEFPLSPLEMELVSRLSGGKVRTILLQELFDVQPSFSLRTDSVTEVYGAVNEVDQLIKDVYASGAPLDRCVVAVTDSAVYGQLFYDAAMEKGVPIAFGCGIAVTNTRPAELLSLWNQWNGAGFHGMDALQDMLYSDAFDRAVLLDLLNQGRTEEEGMVSLRRLTELAGSMRLEPDEQINAQRIDAWEKTLSESAEDLRWVRALHCLGRELGLSCDRFLKKYSNIRKHTVGGPLDKSALNAILDVLTLTKRFPGLITMESTIPMALGLSVGSGAAEPGKLFVTSVTGALSVQRNHLYILGLSADKFPGKPKENALMLDSDWELLPCSETAPTSRNRAEKSRDGLILLDRLAASLNIDVHAYWPDYDPGQLKELIPSSIIYRLMEECPDAVAKKEGYFPSVYSESYAVARKYLDGGEVESSSDRAEHNVEYELNPERNEWAPTAIDTWFGCKRQFLYKYILRLDVSEPDDPMVVISANEIGNMAHHLMEILAEKKLGEEEFRNAASIMFDDYLISRPPMDQHAAEKEKADFVRMMNTAWKEDPGREVVLSEEYLHGLHPCGLRLKGRVDRVEIDENGRHVVVDFKTGRKVTQETDDPQTCRQALIYTWILQQEGKKTGPCEYRYLRRSKNIFCRTDSQIMSTLEDELKRFYNGLKEVDFAPEDGYGNQLKKNDCKYCPYVSVCDLDKTREEALL